MIMSNVIGIYRDTRWWEHPYRPCANDYRFSDIEGTTKAERAEMKTDCVSCPVYYECLNDVLTVKKYRHYGIQAGIQGLT